MVSFNTIVTQEDDTYKKCTHCDKPAKVLCELTSEDPYCGAYVCLECIQGAAKQLTEIKGT